MDNLDLPRQVLQLNPSMKTSILIEVVHKSSLTFISTFCVIIKNIVQ
jgi:hypothetical protein